MIPADKIKQATDSWFLVRLFYLYTGISVLNSGKSFNSYLFRQDSIFNSPIPIFEWTSYPGTEITTVLGYILIVLICFACAWKPWSRELRVTHFASMNAYVWWWFITQVSMKDFDKLMLIQVSFLFLFLPNPLKRIKFAPEKALIVISAVQFNLLLIYSMSGVSKIITSIAGFKTGNALLLPEGLPIRIITHIVGTYSAPELAPMAGPFAALRSWTYPLTLGVDFLQTTAVLLAFKPRYHKACGILLVAMHVANSLLFNIHYFDHIALLGIFLVMSPFAPKRAQFK